MKSSAKVSFKSKIIAAVKIQLNIIADFFLEFGSIRRLNRIYHPEIIKAEDVSKVQKIIARAYRSSRGTLDELVENLPKDINRSFLKSFVENCFSNLDVSVAIKSLQSDGVYVSPYLVPSDIIEELRQLINSGVATPKSDSNSLPKAGKPNASASTWWFDQPSIIANRATQAILTERYLTSVVQGYLGAVPKIVSCTLWKSFPAEAPQKSSAQWFHVDYDRISFVKIFVYLDVVDRANGPHVYVKGSHRRKPRKLLNGKRISDAKVVKAFSENCWSTVTGPSGTLFFADTRGLHKGDSVVEGSRSMFSITYSIDNFGYQAGEGLRKSLITDENLVRINDQFPKFLESVLVIDD
jgi:hypothetical protein